MAVDRAKEMAENAHGSFGATDLTGTNSTSKPIIEYIGQNEQLQYLLTHSSKGFRIFETNGEERTPDHDSGSWGTRCLLISDQRIIYVVGKKSGDKVNEFDYENIITTDANCSFTHCRLNFTLANGQEYKFATHNSDAEEAEEYIEQCIYRRYEELKSRIEKLSGLNVEVPEPTSFDKLWERKNKYDSIEEDLKLWNDCIDKRKQLQQRSTAFSTLEFIIPDRKEFDSPQELAEALEDVETVIEKSDRIVQYVDYLENLSGYAAESKIQEARERADKGLSELADLAQDYREFVDPDSVEKLQRSIESRLEKLEQNSQIDHLREKINEAHQALARYEVKPAKQQISEVKTSLRESPHISGDIQTELEGEISDVESSITDIQTLQETEQIAESKLNEAQIKSEEGEYDAAASIAQQGIETCEEVIENEFPTGNDIARSIKETRSKLQNIQSKAEDVSKLTKTAKQHRESALAAIDSDSYEAAKEAVDEFEQSVIELDEYDISETEVFKNDIDSITRKIERAQATTRVNELLHKVDSKVAQGQEFLIDASVDQANQEFRSAKETLREASRVVENSELQRQEEVKTKKINIEEVIDSVTQISSLLTNVEDSIDSDSYESADSALSELTELVSRVSNNNLVSEPLEKLHQLTDELQSEVDAQLTQEQWSELLEQVDSLSDTAEELIFQNNYTEAESHLISALETLDEAASIDTQSSLRDQDIIYEKQRQIQSLLTKVESEAKQQHSTLITKAEELVAEGIENRKVDDPAGATEAFTKAEEQYTQALQLAEKQNLPEQWETGERHAMVSEYLEITTEELEDRRRETRQEMATALDNAESAVIQAEQYAEVDDTVSVRDALRDVVQHLDTATQLLNVAGVTEELQSRYNSLIERADTLRKKLPDKEDEKSYRNQNLVESLQILTTKLGEPPRQGFVNKYGKYPSEAYLDAFGSWSEALAAANLQQIDESSREQRTYRRVELLEELTTVAEKVDEPPTKSQVDQLGEVASTTIESRFQDWKTALELAGITEPTESAESQSTQDTAEQRTKQRQPEEMEQANILNLIEQEVQNED